MINLTRPTRSRKL